MNNCDQSCRTRRGLCACGAMKDGILQDGRSVTYSVMLKDEVAMALDRKDYTMMMTDSERASEEYRRLLVADPNSAGEQYRQVLLAQDRAYRVPVSNDAEGAYRHMVTDMANPGAPVNDNRLPTQGAQFTRDGRPMSALPDHERAYEQMIIDQRNSGR